MLGEPQGCSAAGRLRGHTGEAQQLLRHRTKLSPCLPHSELFKADLELPRPCCVLLFPGQGTVHLQSVSALTVHVPVSSSGTGRTWDPDTPVPQECIHPSNSDWTV